MTEQGLLLFAQPLLPRQCRRVRPALPTIDPSRQLVRSRPGWEVVELDSGHDPMISAPADLAAVLLTVAER